MLLFIWLARAIVFRRLHFGRFNTGIRYEKHSALHGHGHHLRPFLRNGLSRRRNDATKRPGYDRDDPSRWWIIATDPRTAWSTSFDDSLMKSWRLVTAIRIKQGGPFPMDGHFAERIKANHEEWQLLGNSSVFLSKVHRTESSNSTAKSSKPSWNPVKASALRQIQKVLKEMLPRVAHSPSISKIGLSVAST